MLFETCAQFELLLAQPSLAPASFISHQITIQNTACWVRLTNFVEIMAVACSTATLELRNNC
jgi:hypothetical protein